jgi:hypothetical protein
MRKQSINQAILGGTIGSIIFLIFLVIINRFVPLQTQDLLTFIVLTVSIIIAAYTILGASVLSTSWNDIDERSEKIVAKYEDRAKLAIDQVRQETIQDIDQRQVELGKVAKQSITEIAQKTREGITRQNRALYFSLSLLGGLMVVTYLYNKFPRMFQKMRKWKRK